MDIEKLIEQLRSEIRGPGGLLEEAATALSTLQAENEKLRGELEYEREHANAYHEECGQWEAENDKLRADLEQVKREQCRIPKGYALVKLELLEEIDNVRELGPIGRLRELAQADNEGRCVVMLCQPGDKISYKSGAGLWFNAVVDDYTPENIFITAETEITNAEPLSQVFSILEIEAALRREQDG